MSFLWSRQGDFLTSVCGLCGHVTRERDQRSILDQQRDHDAYTCQRRRLEVARVVGLGQRIARALFAADEMTARASCVSPTMATGLGAALGRIEASETASSVTSKPPLDTPARGASK